MRYREIRRVPLGWKHPKKVSSQLVNEDWVEIERYIPLIDDSFAPLFLDWHRNQRLWEQGVHPAQVHWPEGASFSQWGGDCPNPDDYMPEFPDPCGGWCVYESLSPGTPVTPVFPTAEELIAYLVEHGDYHDQMRRRLPETTPVRVKDYRWTLQAATNLVRKSKTCPSPPQET